MANTNGLIATGATALIGVLAIGCSRDGGVAAPNATVVPTTANASRELRVVGAFYTALGAGDSAGAARLVAPEQRVSGPLSAAALGSYRDAMRRPIRLLSASPQAPGLISVRYHYVRIDGRDCDGAATVQMADRGGQPLIRSIDHLAAC